MNERLRRSLLKVARATSFMLVLKGAVAGSVAMLAVFGVTVPYLSAAFGVEIGDASGGWAAMVGGILGAIAAFRA